MYSAIQNTAIVVNLLTACNDTGWSVDGVDATHVACNSGLCTLTNYPVTAGQTYQVSYSVLSISGGYVQSQTPGSNGAMETTPNIYVETLSPTGNGFVKFYSNANCVITGFNVRNITNNIGTTIIWSAINKKWGDFRNMYPDFGWSIDEKTIVGYQGSLYSAQNGATNSTNNFFGQQFQSKIKIVSAKNPGIVKDYEVLNYQANMLLITAIDGIQSSNGQVSTLIDTDFIKQKLAANGLSVTNYQVDNVYSASILGDENDENIVNGAGMRGNWLIVELVTVDASTPLQIFSIAVRTKVVFTGARP